MVAALRAALLAVALGLVLSGCVATRASPDAAGFVDSAAHAGLTQRLVRDWTGADPGERLRDAAGGEGMVRANDDAPYARGMATMTAGVAVADADGNGAPDLLFSQPGEDLLYLNRGNGTFIDASETIPMPLGASWNGTAALWFDYDNDGWPDLFLGQIQGPSRMLHNDQGHGFTDVSERSGVQPDVAVQGAAAADVNLDGWSDLVVVAYEPWWLASQEGRTGQRDLLFVNQGNGTFVEEGLAWGLNESRPGLAAAFADYDSDGWPDLFVGNDYHSGAQLWHNLGASFFDVAEYAGAQSQRDNMGATWADFNGDGRPDLYVTNIHQSMAQGEQGDQMLFGQGNGRFTDASVRSGTQDAGWAWGACAFDLEGDGDTDLYVANGFPLAHGDGTLWGDQPQRMFVNDGTGNFTDQAARLGLGTARDGRSCAVLDADGDGAPDLVTTAAGEAPHLWLNRIPQAHAIDLDLQGTKANRDAIGASVSVTTPKLIHWAQREAGSGYLGQSSGLVHLGLGQADAADVTIHWPSGLVQDIPSLAAGRYHIMEGGEPKPIDSVRPLLGLH